MTVGTPPETRSTDRSTWTSGTVERRETCMNKGIEAIVVSSPAPSRELLSARTAPLARRLTPTLKPTLSERKLTSKNPLCSAAWQAAVSGAGALIGALRWLDSGHEAPASTAQARSHPELIRRRAAGEPLRELASDYEVAHTTLGRYFERPELAKQVKPAAKTRRRPRLRRLVPDQELIRRRAAGEPLRELASDYDVAHTTLGRYFERPELAKQVREAAKQLRAEAARRSAQRRRLEREVRRKAREQVAAERKQARASAVRADAVPTAPSRPGATSGTRASL
jgi:hypothetical protein